jgi:hypothetical protein
MIVFDCVLVLETHSNQALLLAVLDLVTAPARKTKREIPSWRCGPEYVIHFQFAQAVDAHRPI